MSRTRPKLEVKSLYKLFGDAPGPALERLDNGASKGEVLRETGCVVGVSDVSFTVAPGEIFVVMGLSGSGKSTLVRCINRLIVPTRGEVRVDGEDLVGKGREQLRQVRLKRMSMVFQHFALFPHMTVAENVAFGLKVRGMSEKERREKAITALELVGLEAWGDSSPATLSGGMQQRVGLARGLAVDPEILLMDEPFSALDPLIRRDMQLELLDLQRSIGNSIIFITHDLHEALILGDRIAIMKDGRFVQKGTPEQIVASPADEYVSEFTRDVDRGRVLRVGSIASPPVTVTPASGIPAAEKRLRETERSAIHVVDGHGRPVGLVTRQALAESPDKDLRSLRDVAIRKIAAVRDSSLLIDAYDKCTDGEPLAVVDEQGRLTGTVTPAELLHALAGRNDANEGTENSPMDRAKITTSARTAEES